MLIGDRVLLRARVRADVPVRHQLSSDVDLHQTVNLAPWVPQSLEAAYAKYDKALGDDPDERTASFMIVPKDATEIEPGVQGPAVGYALLWGIEIHQRTAHIGLAMVPEARGHGFGVDAVRLLCDYGFRLRGLARLGCETLATNAAMLATAEAAGFVREGVLRANGVVDGERVDEVVLGLLAEEWKRR